jgi:hypothetical protein
VGLLREEKNSAFRAQPLTSPALLGLAPGLSWRWKIYFHGGSSDVPVGAGNDGNEYLSIIFGSWKMWPENFG